jgi:natural product biosynthesis luciferase-like monooxygenase protein/amino acid adenylation domain-containing protein
MNSQDFVRHLALKDIRIWAEGDRLCFDAPGGVLSASLREELTSRKPQLIAHLQANAPAERDSVLPDAPGAGRYPLSPAQRRMHFLDQFFAEQAPHLRAIHNNPLALRATGQVDVVLLERALHLVIERHDSLRSCFRLIDGEVVQQVLSPEAPTWREVNLTLQPPGQAQAALAVAMQVELAEPIDLEHGPVLRVVWYRVADNDHLLLIVLHHIVSDGWSMEVLTRELLENYEALLRSSARPTSSLPVMQFGQYACLQVEHERTDALASGLAYWRQKLSGIAPLLALPADKPRPSSQSYRTQYCPVEVGMAVTQALKERCRLHATTPFVWLLSALKLLLGRYAGTSDVAVGTAIAGRNDPAYEHSIGYFANTLVLRTQFDVEQPFIDLVHAVRCTVMEAHEAQHIPFERVVAELQPQRSFSYAPLFQVLFVLQIAETAPVQRGNASWRSIEVSGELSPFDLTLYMRDTPEGLRGTLRYATDLFEASSVQAIVEQFLCLVKESTQDPRRPAVSLPLISLRDWIPFEGPPATAAEAALPFTRLIERQAKRTPDAVALRCGRHETSYDELNRRANRLARTLQESGTGPGSVVIVMQGRDEALIVSLLAVAKSGAAYLPLDPTLPPGRVDYIVKDARASHVLIDPGFASSFDAMVQVVQEPPPGDGSLDYDLDNSAPLASMAYLIYTSGSTGQPKGVAVSHASLTNLLLDMRDRIALSPMDRLAAVTTVSFDIAALELFTPLLAGATVVLLDRETCGDADGLSRALDGITVMQATPATWQLLLDSGWRRPRGLQVLCGGEALQPELLQRLATDGQAVWNVYGPTETTVWSTAAKLHAHDSVSLGAPISETRLYILDSTGHPTPRGVPGRLFIGGAGVAIGYWNRPDLTAERFVLDPFAGQGRRMYDTGDLCRVRSDGSIEYLGRSDTQLKIRGYRIEPGEIEGALLADDAISQAVVVAHVDARGQPHLVGHVVPSAQTRNRIALSLFFFSGEAPAPAGAGAYDFMLAAARWADEAGLHAVWTPERHFHEVAGLYPNPAVLGATIAGQTHRIGIRAGSVVLPLHDPVRVAEEWAAVDNLSQGRVGLAFASGWHQQDFVLQPTRYARRHEALEPLVDEVCRLWRGEMVTREVEGRCFEVRTFPRPVSRELPLWITVSNSVSTFELAGRRGANILTHLLGQTVEELVVKLSAYRKARSVHGHDPAGGEVTLMLHAFVARTDAEARSVCREPLARYLRSHIELEQSRLQSGKITDEKALAEVVAVAVERYLDTASLIGSVETGVRIAAKLQALGVTEIACLVDFGVSSSVVLEHLSCLAELKGRLQSRRQIDSLAAMESLRRQLPVYMLPEALVVRDAMPLTSSGKVNRLALAAEAPPIVAVPSARAPSGEEECAVARLWEEVLGRPPASVDDNFFASGGHSLLASQLVSRLRQAFHVGLPLRAVFERPTVAGLSDRLVQLQQQSGRSLPEDEPIPVSAGAALVALPHQQQRQWAFVQAGHPPQVYNKSRAWSLFGQLDAERLRDAIYATAEANRLLRCAVTVSNGIPHLRLEDGCTAAWQAEWVNLSASETRLGHCEKVAWEEACTAFDLGRAPLLRFRLLQFDIGDAALLLTHHGILMDGWSTELLLEEVMSRYAGDCQVTAALRVPQYDDYADWQAGPRSRRSMDSALAYWRARLAGLASLTRIPTDHVRPVRRDYVGARVPWSMDAAISTAMERIAAEEAATPFMLLSAALMACLSRWSDQSAVALGSLYGGRDRAELRSMLGFLANPVLIRARVAPEMTFRALLRQVRAETLTAFANHAVPFDEVVSEFSASASECETFAEVFLVVHTQPTASTNAAGLVVRPVDLPTWVSRYELCFAATPSPLGMSGAVEYSVEIFEQKTVQRLADSWVWLTEAAVNAPDSSVLELWKKLVCGSTYTDRDPVH